MDRAGCFGVSEVRELLIMRGYVVTLKNTLKDGRPTIDAEELS